MTQYLDTAIASLVARAASVLSGGGAGRWSGGGLVAECESGSGESVAEQTPGPPQSSGHCIDTKTIPLYCDDVIRISRNLMISSQLVRYL